MQSTGQAWSLVGDFFFLLIATIGQRCHNCNSCIKWDLEAISHYCLCHENHLILCETCAFLHQYSRWKHAIRYKILRPLTKKGIKIYNWKLERGWALDTCQCTEFSVSRQLHYFLLYPWYPSNNKCSSRKERADCNCGQFNKHWGWRQ